MINQIKTIIEALIAKAREFAPTAVTYVVHLALAWLISWGLRHGIHFDFSYLGLSFVTFFGSIAGKLIARQVGYGWAFGCTEGATEVQQANAARAYAEMVAQAAAAKVATPDEPKTPAPSGAYV